WLGGGASRPASPSEPAVFTLPTGRFGNRTASSTEKGASNMSITIDYAGLAEDWRTATACRRRAIAARARSCLPLRLLGWPWLLCWPWLLTALVAGPSLAITRGYDDDATPEAAIVVQVNNPNGSCTGTLISPTAVLTAKHCVTGDNFSGQNWFGGN